MQFTPQSYSGRPSLETLPAGPGEPPGGECGAGKARAVGTKQGRVNLGAPWIPVARAVQGSRDTRHTQQEIWREPWLGLGSPPPSRAVRSGGFSSSASRLMRFFTRCSTGSDVSQKGYLSCGGWQARVSAVTFVAGTVTAVAVARRKSPRHSGNMARGGCMVG